MPDYLSTAALARALGVAPATVSAWRARSRPGGIYADRPFPEPDAQVSGAPGWLESRLPEIREWMAGRAGMGVGGGRPRKK